MREKAEKSPTALLNELANKQKMKVIFRISEEVYGEDNPIFTCKVVLDDQEIGSGSAPSKKLAQHQASLQAIANLSSRPETKQALQHLYYGSDRVNTNPVSALTELTQSRKVSLRYETAVVCRTFVDGALVATAEAEKVKTAKKESCLIAIAHLTQSQEDASDAGETGDKVNEQTASDIFLLQKSRELAVNSSEVIVIDSFAAGVMNVAGECKILGVVEIVKAGSYATGTLRRDSEVDFAVITEETQLDLPNFADHFTQLLSNYAKGPMSRKKRRKISVDIRDDEGSFRCEFQSEDCFTLQVALKRFRFICLQKFSPVLCHIRWMAQHTLTPEQHSVMRLLKHWKRTNPAKRSVPTELLDWLVIDVCSSSSTGSGFRKVMERLSGGVFLPETNLYFLPFHREILSAWSLSDRVTAMGEAFVALVQIAKDEVAALM